MGYASVFSDGCLTTMFGEFVVHPAFQRRGIGRAMMLAVERAFPSAPIYVKALGASREFYAALGFRTASTPVTCMFRRPGEAARPGARRKTSKAIVPIDAGSRNEPVTPCSSTS